MSEDNGHSVVGIIMGSDSDLDIMSKAAEVLKEFGITHEVHIVSAHRTPDRMSDYAKSAKGQSDPAGNHRRCRRFGASSGHDGVRNRLAGDCRADQA